MRTMNKILLPLLSLFILPASSLAGKGTAAASLPQAYVWYDGDTRKTVWLDPAYVADFSKREEKSESAPVRALSDKQKSPINALGATLYVMGSRNPGPTAVKSLSISDPAGSYSPVFRDGPRAAGSVKALPGDIVVQFRADWSEKQIEEWTKDKALPIVRKLSFSPNTYLLKHRPGLDCLLKANEIRSGGEVLQSYPDWWTNLKPL
jgi:hypothetical protein